MSDSDETIVARLRPHARAIILPTALLLLVAAAVGFLGGVLTATWQLVALAVGAVLALIFGWLVPVLRFAARNYTITTRRIVVRSGVAVRVRQELLLSRGSDVTVRKGPLQSLLGSGDVIVNAGHEATLVLRDVPSANLVQAALHDLMERNRATSV
jgi:membrane protein YdbS with pleckstrin-like domain